MGGGSGGRRGMSNFPRRGEVWLVNLEPAKGAELKKIRPALIVSNDANNQYAELVTVLPVTDRGEKVYPFEVSISTEGTGLNKLSKIKCQQIRTLDKSRFLKYIGRASDDILDEAERAVKIHLGFI